MRINTSLVKGLLILIIFIVILLLLFRIYIPEHLLLIELAALSGLFFLTAYEATKKELPQHARTNIKIGYFFLFLGIIMLILLFIS